LTTTGGFGACGGRSSASDVAGCGRNASPSRIRAVEDAHPAFLESLELVDADVDAVERRGDVEAGEHHVARLSASQHGVDRQQRPVEVEVAERLQQAHVGRGQIPRDEQSPHVVEHERPD
jgi:hypothetical protein